MGAQYGTEMPMAAMAVLVNITIRQAAMVYAIKYMPGIDGYHLVIG